MAWFPKAFTGGCTIECKSLAANGDKIKQYDVSYFMISTDSISKNKGFAEQEKADFPILSDPSRETAKAYGVVSKDTDSPKRWTFYIDKEGKISAIDRSVKPATAAEDMIAKLADLGVGKRK